MIIRKLLESRFIAFGWLFFISVLFMIPGAPFKRQSWFSRINFDKWAHAIVFAVLLFLFCNVFNRNGKQNGLLLLLLAAAYGYAVELVQGYWIPHRDFDWYDLLSDVAGSLAGFGSWQLYKKNKPL